MLYENIVRRCKDRNISIARLEAQAGLGNATIRGWAQSSPRVENLQAVARVLECTVDDLLKEAI